MSPLVAKTAQMLVNIFVLANVTWQNIEKLD